MQLPNSKFRLQTTLRNLGVEAALLSTRAQNQAPTIYTEKFGSSCAIRHSMRADILNSLIPQKPPTNKMSLGQRWADRLKEIRHFSLSIMKVPGSILRRRTLPACL